MRCTTSPGRELVWTSRDGAADRDAELERLRRVEADLEGAIAECRCALEEVRRELRRRDPRVPTIVH